MLNKVMLIGNLGKDPETRYTADGTLIVNFSVATTENYKDKQGNKQQKTEWHSIVAFGKLAEICAKYLVKGSKTYLEGKLSTKAWEDKDGVKRSTTQVILSDMKMLDGKKAEKQGQDAPQEDVPF